MTKKKKADASPSEKKDAVKKPSSGKQRAENVQAWEDGDFVACAKDESKK